MKALLIGLGAFVAMTLLCTLILLGLVAYEWWRDRREARA